MPDKMAHFGNHDADRALNFTIDNILAWDAGDIPFVDPYQKVAMSPDQRSDGVASFDSASSGIDSSASSGIDSSASQDISTKKIWRMKITTDHLMKLERYFEIDAYPSKKDRILLAKVLALSENQITRWFQKRRNLYKEPSTKGLSNVSRYQPYPPCKSPFPDIAYPPQEYYMSPIDNVYPPVPCQCDQCMMPSIGGPLPLAGWPLPLIGGSCPSMGLTSELHFNPCAQNRFPANCTQSLKPNYPDYVSPIAFGHPLENPPQFCFQEHRYPTYWSVNPDAHYLSEQQNEAETHALKEISIKPTSSPCSPVNLVEDLQSVKANPGQLPRTCQSNRPALSTDCNQCPTSGLSSSATEHGSTAESSYQSIATMDLSQVDYRPRYVTENGIWQTDPPTTRSAAVKRKRSGSIERTPYDTAHSTQHTGHPHLLSSTTTFATNSQVKAKEEQRKAEADPSTASDIKDSGCQSPIKSEELSNPIGSQLNGNEAHYNNGSSQGCGPRENTTMLTSKQNVPYSGWQVIIPQQPQNACLNDLNYPISMSPYQQSYFCKDRMYATLMPSVSLDH